METVGWSWENPDWLQGLLTRVPEGERGAVEADIALVLQDPSEKRTARTDDNLIWFSYFKNACDQGVQPPDSGTDTHPEPLRGAHAPPISPGARTEDHRRP